MSYRIDVMEGLVRHPRETLPEHHALIELSRGKPDQAEKLARQHFNRSRQRLLREMKQEKREKAKPGAYYRGFRVGLTAPRETASGLEKN